MREKERIIRNKPACVLNLAKRDGDRRVVKSPWKGPAPENGGFSLPGEVFIKAMS